MRTKTTSRGWVFAAFLLIVASCGGGATGATTTTVGPTTTSPGATQPPQGTTTTTVETPTTGAPSDVIELGIEAVDSEGYSEDRLTARAGVEVRLTFNNKDNGGEPHNIHVRTDSEDFFTQVKTGPDTQTLVFTIGTPGEYQFFCDTHSEAMKGILIVEG